MFYERTWYQHPDYGPMIIDKDLLQMIEPVCEKIEDSSPDAGELLSIPLPYANFFCAIPPWHGYVQTFFDTTSKQTIKALMEELESSPPKWIFYQRQLWTLGVCTKLSTITGALSSIGFSTSSSNIKLAMGYGVSCTQAITTRRLCIREGIVGYGTTSGY